MKKIALMLAVVAVGFSACKKEETDSGSGAQTTEEKIVGKWMGDEFEITIVAPPPIGTQTQKEDMSYLNVEFKSDGTALADSSGISQGSSTWSLIGDTKMILDGDTFDIKVLDASNFHFGMEESEDIGGGVIVSSSTTIKLKK